MLFLFVLMLVGVDSSRLARRDAARASGSPPSLLGLGFAVLLVGALGARGHRHGRGRPRPRRTRDGNVHGHRPADLHQVRLRVRGHQRAADHRRARRDGARAPRAARAQADPARAVRAAVPRRRHPAPLPGPGVFARHNAVDTPGAAARRHARRGVGLARSSSRRGDVRTRRRRRRAAPARSAATEEDERDEPDQLPRTSSALLFTIGAVGVLRAPQRDRRVHVRRADAQRGQPRVRHVRPHATATSTARSSRSS